MNTYNSPKVELTETELISGRQSTNPIVVIIGGASTGYCDRPIYCSSIRDFKNYFGNPVTVSGQAACYLLKQNCVVLYRRVVSNNANAGATNPISKLVKGANGKYTTASLGEDFIPKFVFSTKNFDSIYEGYRFEVKFENDKCSVSIYDKKKSLVREYLNMTYADVNAEDYIANKFEKQNSVFDISVNEEGSAESYVAILQGINDGSVFTTDPTHGDLDKQKAYIKAINEFSNPDVYTFTYFLTPGVLDKDIQQAVIGLAERGYSHDFGTLSDPDVVEFDGRKDFVYFPDVPSVSDLGAVLNTVNTKLRADFTYANGTDADLLDRDEADSYLYGSSYCALYYPDIKVVSAVDKTSILMPSSVIGCNINIKAFNNTGNIWTPGAGCYSSELLVNDVVEAYKLLTVKERDSLCVNRVPVNPITYSNGIGYWINGNKSGMYYNKETDESVFNNLHIRKLLNYVKRNVVNISRGFLFRNNNETTWESWKLDISTFLEDVKNREGIEAYKVVMDSSTVTEEDILNNTAPGFIYLKPTKVMEYIPISVFVTEDSVYFEEEA